MDKEKLDNKTASNIVRAEVPKEKFKTIVAELLVELARVREYIRRVFPDLAHVKYGESQKYPSKVSRYTKAVLDEATKKGRITPAPSQEESS